MAAILSIEGAELIGCDPGQVETAAEWGVRFLNPVWNWPNVLSGTNCRDTDRGLSPLGADFLRQLEACHICPDVSHISDPGFWDVVRLARGPVVATHSNSRALCPHRRNLTDDMFWAIRDSGGVVGLNLYRPFVGPAIWTAAGPWPPECRASRTCPACGRPWQPGAIPRPCWRTCSGTICGGWCRRQTAICGLMIL